MFHAVACVAFAEESNTNTDSHGDGDSYVNTISDAEGYTNAQAASDAGVTPIVASR